jgi:hypothetical protein
MLQMQKCFCYRSAVGAWDVRADLLHGLVDVVLPHGVALGSQIRTSATEDVSGVVAVVAAAIPFAVPSILDILKLGQV